MPFRDPEAGDLATRISAGIRQRIEEAIEAACLEIVVNVRRARGLPAPAADSVQDRAEYEQVVRELLTRLKADLVPLLDEGLRTKVTLVGHSVSDPVERLVAIQVTLARELPDYWQRFDAIRTTYATERAVSGGESGGLLGRLFGRG
jgi:hypothetical protein